MKKSCNNCYYNGKGCPEGQPLCGSNSNGYFKWKPTQTPKIDTIKMYLQKMNKQPGPALITRKETWTLKGYICNSWSTCPGRGIQCAHTLPHKDKGCNTHKREEEGSCDICSQGTMTITVRR